MGAPPSWSVSSEDYLPRLELEPFFSTYMVVLTRVFPLLPLTLRMTVVLIFLYLEFPLRFAMMAPEDVRWSVRHRDRQLRSREMFTR